MLTIKRILVSMLLVATLATPALAEQQENAFKTVFQDAFYGGLSGALVGAALLAFTKQPGKHLDYMGYGGAGGVLVGATYGIVSVSRSLAEIENGRVKFAMPSLMPELREGTRGTSSVMVTAQLIRGRF
ncbi:hypothetical protein L4X63_16690 [Geomonas sp. Red32]|uniref:hypothetical protein n=1 Tax=Geomonas sp. Red32 TaxID=2912856 RepID=UPI00202D090F|nr:hypothetical protein [Geomonas sp. Red32]MCM0083224.1 hypothetical protein [Geomonas sp. Red32]